MLNDPRKSWLLAPALLLALLAAAPVSAPRAQDSTREQARDESAGAAQQQPAARTGCVPEALVQGAPWPATIPGPWQRWRELMALGKCRLAAGEPELAASAFAQGASEAPELEPAWRLNLLRARIAAGATEEAAALLALLAGSNVPGVRETVRAILTGQLTQSVPDAVLANYVGAYLAATPAQPEDYDLVLALQQRGGEDLPAPGGRPLRLLLWRGPKDEASARLWRDAPQALAAQGQAPPPEDYLARVRQLRRLRLHAMIREEFDAERLAAQGVALALPPESARAIGQTWFWALGRTRSFTQALQAL